MNLLDRLNAIREAWAMTFGTTPPANDVLYRWLGIAPQEVIERSLIKCAGWARAQKVTPTQRQLEKRIKNTLFWLQATNGISYSQSHQPPRNSAAI
jgi:hypothetical protein